MISFLSYLIILSLMYFVNLKLESKFDFKFKKHCYKVSFEKVILYVLSFGFFIIFLYSLLSYFKLVSVDKIVLNLDSVFMIIVSLILAPIVEEYFFRLIPLVFVKDKGIKVIVIFISSLLFALFHEVVGSQFIVIFIGGVILSLMFLKTKNLYYSIVSHSFYNFLVLVFSFVFSSLIFVILSFILFLVSFIYLCKKM